MATSNRALINGIIDRMRALGARLDDENVLDTGSVTSEIRDGFTAGEGLAETEPHQSGPRSRASNHGDDGVGSEEGDAEGDEQGEEDRDWNPENEEDGDDFNLDSDDEELSVLPVD